MRTVERMASWDEDGDGRIGAGEIPYHFLINIAPSTVSGLVGAGTGTWRAVVPSLAS